MRRLIVILTFVSCVTLLICGCTARRGVLVDRVPELNTVEQQGRQVFMDHCNFCHPGGASGLGLALNNKPLPAALIAFQVRNGIGAMPAFPEKKISKEELSALVDYLIALRRAD